MTPIAAHSTLAQAAPSTMALIAVLVVAVLIALIFLMWMVQYLNLWLQAMLSGAPVSFFELLGMRLRKVDPRLVVLAHIRAKKVGIDPGVEPLQVHYLAGGDIRRVVTALVEAKAAGLELSWDQACAIDLAGYDVHAAVKTAIQHDLSAAELSSVAFLKQIGVPQMGTAAP